MGKLLHKKIDYTGVSPYEFVPIKEADYNALTPAEQEDETKMYWLYDADTVSADIDDESVSSGKVWSSEKVNSEISDVQDQVDTNTDDISTLNSALDNIPILKSSDYDTGSVQITRDSTTDMYYGTVNIEAPADASYAVAVCWVNTSWNACVIGVVSNPYIADNKKMFMVWFASSKSMTIPNKRIRIWYI